MQIFTMKTMLTGAGVLAVVLVIAALTGRKSVHAEIFIPAPPKLVWQVLTDTDAYPEWNPIMEDLEGEFKEDSDVQFKFIQEPGKSYLIKVKVRRVVENGHLNQSGGMYGILTYDHHYILEPKEEGTQVTIHEDYRGIGVHFWNPAAVQDAYERVNAAMKARVLKISKVTG